MKKLVISMMILASGSSSFISAMNISRQDRLSNASAALNVLLTHKDSIIQSLGDDIGGKIVRRLETAKTFVDEGSLELAQSIINDAMKLIHPRTTIRIAGAEYGLAMALASAGNGYNPNPLALKAGWGM